MENLNDLSRSEVAKLHGYLFLPYVRSLSGREAEILESLKVLSAYRKGDWTKAVRPVRKRLRSLKDPELEVRLPKETKESLIKRFSISRTQTKVEEPCALCKRYSVRISDNLEDSPCGNCPLARWELQDTLGCVLWLEAVTGIDFDRVPGLHIGSTRIVAFTEKARAWIESVRILGKDFVKFV